MSDFVTRLELDLLDAAARLHSGGDSARPASRTGHRRGKGRLIVVGLAVLLVAAPALAGVPGVWRGVLDGPERQPTLTGEQPDPQLLAQLGALRRPATAVDRSALATAAVTHSGPLDGVSVQDVRYVGVSPIGDPLFLVPYRSRIRLIPEETDTGGPPPLRLFLNRSGGSAPANVTPAHRAPDRANLRRFLNRPGVCLIGVAIGTPEIEDCAASSEIAAGTDYATVGVYRTSPEAQPSPSTSANLGHVIATLASGIVPDGVASVELTFSSGNRLTLPVRDNYFALLVGPNEVRVPAITWVGQHGRVLRRLPAG
jgi:hypothetical protein